MSTPTVILGLFETPLEAQLAMQALITAGVGESEISIIMPGEVGHVGSAIESRVSSRLTAGLGAGAAAGGALGLLAGLGAFAIPGLGPILAAGPIVAALEGAGFGAIAGGFAGTLSDVGIPESKLEYYGESVRSGSVLVLAHASNTDVPRLHKVMEECGALETAERQEPEEISGQKIEEPKSSQVISLL